MLSDKTIAIIKTITPAVAAQAEIITQRFYERMFRENPELQAFFNHAHQHSGGQQKALAGAICAYFAHIDNLAILTPAIELIAHKHVSLGVQPEHYPIVGKHLLAAIGEVMGSQLTEEVAFAVTEAYSLLAKVCINREHDIYKEQQQQEGGWVGYRKFLVSRKVTESKVITSFYLQAANGGPLPNFKPGQYLTIRIPQLKIPHAPRNYSLSDRPGTGYFRISVKKELAQDMGTPDGLISTFLHEQIKEGDAIEVGPPCGNFSLDAVSSKDTPLVFLAGGVGITPLLAMLKHLAHADHPSAIYLLQAAKNSQTVGFSNELQSLASQFAKFEHIRLLDAPLPDDRTSGLSHKTGALSEALIKDSYPYQSAHFFLCGPIGFMKVAFSSLKNLGVPDERIHYEWFGPKQQIA